MLPNEPWAALATSSLLTKEERLWRSRYDMLESRGYCLRQRYKPDWVPSWLKSKRPAALHEDYAAHWVSDLITAREQFLRFSRTLKQLTL